MIPLVAYSKRAHDDDVAHLFRLDVFDSLNKTLDRYHYRAHLILKIAYISS
jgi:hypothetical protein